MKHISFYLDFISPYAYLAFAAMPEALLGQSYSVTYKPVLFGALLKHYGQLGPAEIVGKREWTYRQVLWLAGQRQLDLQMPAAHPFNPLGLLRLAVACGAQGQPSRYVCEALFQHVWQDGLDATDPQRLKLLTELLSPVRPPDSDDVKARLKANTDEAITLGVFGVPTFEVDGKLFWGLDALPMLAGYLRQEPWFDGPQWAGAAAVPVSVKR